MLVAVLACSDVRIVGMSLFTFIPSTTSLFQHQAVHAVDFPFLNVSVPECWDQDTMLGAGHIYRVLHYITDFFFFAFSTMVVGEKS